MPGQVPFRELADGQLLKDVAYPGIESSFLQMQYKGMKNKSFIGIDISKNVIDASIFCAETPIKGFPHGVFDNSRSGFDSMCKWLRKSKVVLSQALFGMEFTGCYSMGLEEYLTTRKLQFCMLDTHAVKHHPLGSWDKSDKVDSAKIADFIYRFDGTNCAKPYKLPGKTLLRLKELVSERKFLVETRTDFLNRIQQMDSKAETCMFGSYVKKLNHDIEKIEREEADLMATDEALLDTYKNLMSIPGIGHVNAVNTIVFTRNFSAFDTARQYARYVGVAPCHHTSGTSVRWRSRPSARCNGQAKADLSMAALRAVESDEELHMFYNRKLGGKEDADTKRKALNAVKFKLILRMFAIGKQKRRWKSLNDTCNQEPLVKS